MPSHPKPVDPRRLYQQVADQIRAVIDQGGFAPGTRLPPERELALQLGVSRPSLREALIALEIEGRVEIRMGSGIYVCAAAPSNGSPPAPLLLGESPSELMQARSVLEGAVVALATARVTKQGLEQLRACLDLMRQDLRRGHEPVEADRRFHVVIAEMAGNSVLARMVGELFDGRFGPISSRLSLRVESVHTWESALLEHEAIYRALEARDPHEATAAMFGHLTASRARWLAEDGVASASR